MTKKSKDKSLIFLETEHMYALVSIPALEKTDYVNKKEFEKETGYKGKYERFKSVTTILGKFGHHFDADDVLDKMFKKHGQKIYDGSEIYTGYKIEYQGMTKEQIKQQWNLTRDRACQYGTYVHKEAEEYSLGNRPEWDEDAKTAVTLRPEFKQVKMFYKETGLKCKYSEKRVCDIEHMIAGTLDLVMEDDEGNLYIYDWKTNENKDLSDMVGDEWTKKMKEPIDHIPDTPYWHYALQFSMYRYIMEKNEGIEFHGQALVHLKREGIDPVIIRTPYLKNEIEAILASL